MIEARSKFSSFLRCARSLGRTPREQFKILWALSKNVRVRAHLGRYSPERLYALDTVLGKIYLRDNFGDVTNLSDLLVENVYRVTRLSHPGEIIDAGANIGLFARWIHVHNPGRRIHCFEPLESNAEMVRKNCSTAVVNQIGLGSVAGMVSLGVDSQNVMASSIAQPWNLQPINIQVIPLDTYAEKYGIGEVAFFKLDTEGMEIDVLDGAIQVLKHTHQVAMETHGEERHRSSLKRLSGAGFRIDAEELNNSLGMIWASRG